MCRAKYYGEVKFTRSTDEHAEGLLKKISYPGNFINVTFAIHTTDAKQKKNCIISLFPNKNLRKNLKLVAKM